MRNLIVVRATQVRVSEIDADLNRAGQMGSVWNHARSSAASSFTVP